MKDLQFRLFVATLYAIGYYGGSGNILKSLIMGLLFFIIHFCFSTLIKIMLRKYYTIKQLLTTLLILAAISATGQTKTDSLAYADSVNTYYLTHVRAMRKTLDSMLDKKDTSRYFEAMYFGQDTLLHLKYGTYYFTTNGGFPTKEEVQKVIIDNYKLQFSYNSNKLAIILKEFKNEDEYNKFNHPL